MILQRYLAVYIFMFICLSCSAANACVIPSQREINELTDVEVEGTFLVDSAEKGEGRIIAKKVSKGIRKRTYRVRWHASPEETFQEHEMDCVVRPPQNATYSGFNLSRDKDGRYSILSRWQRVKKGE